MGKLTMRLSISSIVLFLFLSVTALPAFAAEKRETAAPDFTLPTSSGTLSFHDLRGKVVLVDFWASWCMPCRESFPWMSTMLDQYSSKGFTIVAVNLDKDRDKAYAFLERFPAQFPVVFDPSGKTAEAFHVEAMPSSFIVGRDGKIVYAHQGFEEAKAHLVEDRIKEALSK